METCEFCPESDVVAPRIFATTNWNVVLAVGEAEPALAHDALEHLCEAYWYPIYVYVRRNGYGPDEAKDLTQEFFAQLIAKRQLLLADPNKGRFRSFLLATLRYFLAREWSRAHRQKRGGHCTFVSLNSATEEGPLQLEAAEDHNPEKQFHRQWALTVLKRVMQALETECDAAGKGELFREAKDLLSGERDRTAYARIGSHLSMAEGTVRVAVHRLRQRYGQLLRAEVEQTVKASSEIDEELRFLARALSN